MIDNIQNAIKNKKLILFGEIHRTKDTLVSPNNTQLFYDSSNSKIKFLKLIKNVDPRYSDMRFKEEILTNCIDFIKELI